MKNKPTLYVPDFDNYASPFEGMFDVITSDKQYDCEVAKVADIVMLTGGGDIHPSYYNQQKHPHTHVYGDRDKHEHKLIQTCLDRQIPILGICRGAEWLSIVAGGSLFQHVSSHDHSHGVTWGKIKFSIHTSSLHHQMCDLTNVPDAQVLAWADGISNYYEKEDFGVSVVPPRTMKEPEVFWIPSIKGFGIQGHPEMMTDHCQFNVLSRMALAAKLGFDITAEDEFHFKALLATQKEISFD